jgi:hypothetical protein
MAHNLRNFLINLAGILIAFLLGAVVMILRDITPWNNMKLFSVILSEIRIPL